MPNRIECFVHMKNFIKQKKGFIALWFALCNSLRIYFINKQKPCIGTFVANIIMNLGKQADEKLFYKCKLIEQFLGVFMYDYWLIITWSFSSCNVLHVSIKLDTFSICSSFKENSQTEQSSWYLLSSCWSSSDIFPSILPLCIPTFSPSILPSSFPLMIPSFIP